MVRFDRVSFYYEEQGYFFYGQMSGCRIKHNWEVDLVTGQILI